ncbi:MotE family protein [Sphingosinicella terrae]|uniref:MotE family protein n=1 Tax=Sphingosinicella terrae TaxID=2172047 RepID=UPI000E0E065E|nr:hypothetical protein [Sphingosinicella terrae]
MKMRPSLLMLMAATAGVGVLANGVSAADPAAKAPETRLGASIKQDMTARDQELARRNRALELREQAARAAEQRLAAGGAAAASAAEAGGAPAAGPSPEEERFAELARIYQAMRPNRAAIVFEQLEMDVQVEVAGRMRERSTALILANMSPPGAAALTMAMARRDGPEAQRPAASPPRPQRR